MEMMEPTLAWLERVNRLSLQSRLVASTLHDMNNALQVLGGGVELLQLPPVNLEGVSRAIGGKAERMNVLIQDLTRFMRDAGGAPEPVDLRALAEEALGLRHHALARLRVVRSVDGEPVTIRIVRREVLQVLLNLLVNAEAALRGRAGPTLRMVVAASAEGATVSVEDNGSGVPEAQRERLFDVEGGGPRAGTEDLGIGLAVSRALAERRGGTLVYTPREPAGSTFTLRLRA